MSTFYPLKVWLDDERDPPLGWYWVKTAEQAIFILENEQVSEISLDHDLGDNNGTGYDVICYLEREVYTNPLLFTCPKVFIHTQNPVGRDKMEKTLANILRKIELELEKKLG